MDSKTLLNFLQQSAESFKNLPTTPENLPALESALAKDKSALIDERDKALQLTQKRYHQLKRQLDELNRDLAKRADSAIEIPALVVADAGTSFEQQAQQIEDWVTATRQAMQVQAEVREKWQRKLAQSEAPQEALSEAETSIQTGKASTRKAQKKQNDEQATIAQSLSVQPARPSLLSRINRGRVLRWVGRGMALVVLALLLFAGFLYLNRPSFSAPPMGTLLIQFKYDYDFASRYDYVFLGAEGVQEQFVPDNFDDLYYRGVENGYCGEALKNPPLDTIYYG